MKKSIRAFRAGVVAVGLAYSALGVAVAAPTLSIMGPSTSVVGASFSLNVIATDMADLYGYQFDVTFNPSTYRSTGVSEGSFLSTAGSTYFGSGTADNTTGTVSFVFDTLLGDGPGATGTGVLATLNFTTVGAGAGTFAIANVSALNSALGDIAVTTQSINAVALVPEPSTWAIMFAGVAALALYSRRRAGV